MSLEDRITTLEFMSEDTKRAIAFMAGEVMPIYREETGDDSDTAAATMMAEYIRLTPMVEKTIKMHVKGSTNNRDILTELEIRHYCKTTIDGELIPKWYPLRIPFITVLGHPNDVGAWHRKKWVARSNRQRCARG